MLNVFFVTFPISRLQFPLSLLAMHLPFVIGVLFLFAGCQSGEQGSSCPDAGKLSWMAGNWKLADDDVYERWTIDGDSRLLGSSFAIENGDTILLENMTVDISNGQGAFVVRVVAQNENQPVAFVLTRCAEGRLLFENAQHDFPQRVAYERGENGTLLAWVEGGERKLTFTYQRAE